MIIASWDAAEIRKFRIALNMTQAQFAYALGGACQQKVSNWEKGKSKPQKAARILLDQLYSRTRGERGVG